MAQVFDVIKIVDELDRQQLLRKSKITGNYYTCHCPIHNKGNERRPSCGILINRQVKASQVYPAGFTNCFTCGPKGSLPEFITAIFEARNIPNTGPQWLVQNGFMLPEEQQVSYLIPTEIRDGMEAKLAISALKSHVTKKEVEYVSEAELQSYRFDVPYMWERGLTPQIVEKYDIGFDANFLPKNATKTVPCITFPIRDRTGGTVYIARRAIQGKSFYLPESTDKPVYGLYELPADCKRLWICEGVFDALAAVREGYHAVALLGLGSTVQLNQIKSLGLSEIVLALDADEYGERRCNYLKSFFKDTAICYRAKWSVAAKDLGELPKGNWNQIITLE